MAGYEKFLLADFQEGMQTDAKPWLLPARSFEDAKNCYIYNGVIYKRKGYTEFDRLAPAERDLLCTGDGVTTTFSGTLTNTEVRIGDCAFVFDTTQSGTEEVTDATASGVLASTVSGTTGTIDYSTGDWSVTLVHPVISGTACSGTYSYYSGDAVVGLWDYYTDAGAQDLIAFDTKRMYRYSSVEAKFYDVDTAVDYFTGDSEDLIWVSNFVDKMYITNNLDQPKVWDGSNLTDMDMLLAVSGTNEINTALLLFTYKNRLVMLRTNEVTDGNCPQRARWCAVNDPTDWTGDEYVDAPTEEWIQSADYRGDDLIVFFDRSVWKLSYTGDADLPFEWRKVAEGYGSYATYSTGVFSDELMTRSATNVVATDGINNVYVIDKKIPDFMIESNPDKAHLSYNGHLDEIRQTWMTYAGVGSDTNDKILILNYEENSWSWYDIPVTCFGFYTVTNDITWNDLVNSWNSYEITWDDRTQQAGYPTTLGGSLTGYVWQMNDGGSDNGAAIEMDLKSRKFNPYKDQGMDCRLGWIEFFFKADPHVTVTIELYMNDDTQYYQTTDITVEADFVGQEKVWKRIYSGAIAWNHSFRVYNSATSETIELHGVRMAMKPAGGRGGI